jgi:murein DD-endopeptidase MepM/ murein hydrolase activator NlpD
LSELHRVWGVVASAVGLLALAPVAVAGDSGSSTGGVAMPDEPEVERVACMAPAQATTGGQPACPRGGTAVIEGESLDEVRRVRFLGGRGRRDDRVARPRERADNRLTVRVPSSARSGPVAVESSAGRARSTQRLQVLARAAATAAPETGAATPAPAGSEVFPVRGAHTYGTHTNTFGGGRGHQGQDVFAECGTPLVALTDATVQHKAFQSRAGHYVVLQRADGESYAYMHLQQASPVDDGDRVRAGQVVGRVGDTGRASGCHLHFEQWTAPGWYEGGRAIDPLPLLRRLDR